MSDESTTPATPRSPLTRALRILAIVVVVAVVIVVLFTTVFPWIEQRTQVPTIGAAGGPPPIAVTSV